MRGLQLEKNRSQAYNPDWLFDNRFTDPNELARSNVGSLDVAVRRYLILTGSVSEVQLVLAYASGCDLPILELRFD